MITFRKSKTLQAETLEDLLISNGMFDAIDESSGYARVDFNRLDFDELVEKFGADRASLAYFGSLSREYIGKPTMGGYPPTIFISYRRESDEIIEWVNLLAEYLNNEGYGVLLDSIWVGDINTGIRDEIPKFLSNIHRANIFLPIITKGYVEGTSRPWIHAERETALLQALELEISIVNVLLDEIELPDAGSYFFETLNLTDDRLRFDKIIDKLPKVHPIYTKAEKEKILSLLFEYHEMMVKYQYSDIIESINASPFKELTEFKEFLCIAYALNGDEENARLIMPFTELTSQRKSKFRLGFCKSLLKLGARGESLRFLWPLFRDFGSNECGAAHAIAGEILEDADNLQSALNHYAIAASTVEDENLKAEAYFSLAAVYLKMSLKSDAENILSFLAKSIEMPYKIVVEAVLAALKDGNIFDAQHMVNVSLRMKRGKNREPVTQRKTARHIKLQCTYCKSSYIIDPTEERICTLCSSPYLWSMPELNSGVGHCPHCCYNAFSRIDLLEKGIQVGCPVCRQGVLEEITLDAGHTKGHP